MQPSEDFIREFLHARCVEEQRAFKSRTPFLEKYYGEEYLSNRTTKKLEMLQSEKIVDVTNSDSESVVTTVHTNPFYEGEKQIHWRRYHLMPTDNGWLVQFTENQCQFCWGLGDSSCPICKGNHWCRTIPE
jgi:hypothetical protein